MRLCSVIGMCIAAMVAIASLCALIRVRMACSRVMMLETNAPSGIVPCSRMTGMVGSSVPRPMPWMALVMLHVVVVVAMTMLSIALVFMVLGLLSPDVDMPVPCAWDCAGIALPVECR